jgi:hypothetical protein
MADPRRSMALVSLLSGGSLELIFRQKILQIGLYSP